jgi:uncharacterized protein
MREQTAASAVITGAGGGLGGAFALQAARQGWNLILVDLPGTGLADLSARLSRMYGVEAEHLEMDLTLEEDRRALARRVNGGSVPVRLLVNNAGTGCQASFDDAPLARLSASVGVNVQATMELTWLLLPLLKRQPRAMIINVASLAAFYPMPAMAVYAATKSFVLSFTLALGAELEGSGVTVSALCPAGMITNRETAEQVRAQGFWGRVTTWEPERVAALALTRARRGAPVIVPGVVNQVLRLVGGLAPRPLVAGLILRRWKRAGQALEARRAGTAASAPAAAPC